MERTVNYERTLTGSYMITEAGEESFDEILIRRKKLPGVLEMKRRSVNGNGEFWYTITGKQSLDTLYSLRKASIEQMKDVILQVCIQLENLEKNLISIDCLVLKPELIFMDNQTRKLFFMLDPEEKRPAADRFREMMEDLLSILDHSDPEGVKAFYELYQISMDEGYSIADIRRAMEKKEAENGQGVGNAQNVKKEVQEKEQKKPEDFGLAEEESLHLTGAFNWEEDADENPLTEEKEKKKRKKEKKKAQRKERKAEPKEGILKRWIRGLREREQKEREQEDAELFGMGFDQEDMLTCIPTSGQNKAEDPDDGEETILVDIRNLRPEGILLYEGNEDYENIRIRDEKVVLGKGKDVDFRLNRSTISRYHARITREEDGNYYIEDLNSTNGTYLNEKIVNFREKTLLRINDVIRLADLKYRFI